MQTFLPYPSFQESAKVLDYRRLGKQRVEAMQIFNCLKDQRLGLPVKGWKNHPAVLMWNGFEFALLDYLEAVIIEWKSRGYRNNIDVNYLRGHATGSSKLPLWLGKRELHISHQSSLVRKFPGHYKRYFDVDGSLPYYWPVRVS